jgi:hypothetical protein
MTREYQGRTMDNEPRLHTAAASEVARSKRGALMSNLQRGVIFGAAALAFTGAGWGLATATTSAPKSATACMTSKGVLVLSSNGSCRKGLSRVHLPLTTNTGPRGPQGVPGTPGAAGAAGGLKGFTRVIGSPNTFGPGGPNPTFASCPTGTVVIGGGAVSLGTGATMVGSYPNTDTSWEVDVTNNGGGSVEVFTTAICAATG